jgi:hypothetical protein
MKKKGVAELVEAAIQAANPTQGEKNLGKQRHEKVSGILQGAGYTTFLTGSYARDTATRPLHDVDMFVVLSGSAHTVQSVRKALFELLRKESQDMGCRIEEQEHSLGLIWPDKLNVDIVPARPLDGGPGFQIGSKSLQGWKATYPKQAKETLSLANGECPRLIPLIKLLKVWNLRQARPSKKDPRKKKKPLKSFHLEVMCYSTSEALLKAKNDRHRIRDLFCHLYTLVSQNVYPPGAVVGAGAGGGEALNTYFQKGSHDWTLEEVRSRLFESFRAASDAVTAEDTGDSERATQLWAPILGPLFPLK